MLWPMMLQHPKAVGAALLLYRQAYKEWMWRSMLHLGSDRLCMEAGMIDHLEVRTCTANVMCGQKKEVSLNVEAHRVLVNFYVCLRIPIEPWEPDDKGGKACPVCPMGLFLAMKACRRCS